ncbi:MAG: rhamnogalacturonan acetylesterase [Opitutaceae bacterium]
MTLSSENRDRFRPTEPITRGTFLKWMRRWASIVAGVISGMAPISVYGQVSPAPDLTADPAARSTELDPTLPTLFIAGDSTAARGSGEDQMGWAAPFADYFDAAKVNVVNRARGGRSSRTFITEGLWDGLVAEIRSGDIVLIQFGHNDGGPVNDERRARGSLPGLGEETEAIDNLVTGKHEVVHTFGWYLRRMIADVRAKDATPIVLSLTVRNIWKDGRVERGSGQFGPWSYEVARDAGVPFIDVTNFVADSFDADGEDRVSGMYPRDHTHFNAEGAERHAAAVVALLKGLRPDPVDGFLSEKGKSVAADPLSWLNLPMPADRRLPTLFLIGDSTVRNGRGDGAGGQWGWGDYLGPLFDEEKINVVNRAVGGLSSRTYLTQGHWARVLGMLKAGDFVMMQFGHNDNGPLNDDRRARGTIKGVGEETEEIDNLLTGKHEVVHTYGWYLRQYVADARQREATPIICSLVPRKSWKDGRVVRNRDSYAGWAAEVADSEDASFVDLNEIVASHYEEIGPERVEDLFADEHTHTSETGAVVNAAAVVTGLRSLPENPLEAFLQIEP